MYNPQVPAWDRLPKHMMFETCNKRRISVERGGKKRPQKESINKDIVLGKKATS